MELFGLPVELITQGGAVGLLALVIVAILLGRLVPRRSLEDVREDRDARLAASEKRGDEWRAAALIQDERNDVLAQQITQLLDSNRTTNALIEGMKQALQERP